MTTKTVKMRRTAINVNVKTIRIVVNDANVSAQRVKDRLGNRRSRAVGTVKADLDAL